MSNIEYIDITELLIIVTDESKYNDPKLAKLLTYEQLQEVKQQLFDRTGMPLVEEYTIDGVTRDGKKVKVPQSRLIFETKKVTTKIKKNNFIVKVNKHKMKLLEWGNFHVKNPTIEYEKIKLKTTRFKDWQPETQIISTDGKSKTQNIRLTVFI